MDELIWWLRIASTTAQGGQMWCCSKKNWVTHISLKSFGQKVKQEQNIENQKHQWVFSPSPRLYRRRTSHACRASLLSKPSRAAWFRQRTARVKATPSYHCPTSRPQISSKVTLARSLLPCALSDLSLKTSSTRQSGGGKESAWDTTTVESLGIKLQLTLQFCIILNSLKVTRNSVKIYN